jgi:hypothetical protein
MPTLTMRGERGASNPRAPWTSKGAEEATLRSSWLKGAVLASHCEYAGRVAFLIAVLVLGATGCGEDGGGGGPAGSEESKVETESREAPGEVDCGRPFQLPASGELRLVGRFPESVPAGQQTVSGTVEVTTKEAVRGVAAARADAFLVREGRVVTTPLVQDALGVRWDLAAGEAKKVPGTASLVSCEPNGGPVPPGEYELYAGMVLTPDDGAPTRSFGGPWPLRVE